MKLQSLRRRLLLQYLLTVGLLLVAAEVLLYAVVRWAEWHELDATVRKEIEKLAAGVELEPDNVEIDNKDVLNAPRLDGRVGAWQVILEDGRTLARSADATAGADLPAVGQDELPLDELRIADAAHGDWTHVRAARLRTVRHRIDKPGRPLRMPEQMVIDLRAVLDCAPLQARLQALGWLLAGSFPLLLGVAGFGGLLLIQRAVRPVELAFDRERRFTGAASHELRTPLTALRGEIDVTLRHPRTPDEYVATLERMDALVARMTALVEGLLVIARADAGHLLLGAGEVSVAELRQAIDEVVRLLPGHDRVAVECMAPEDARIVGDRLLLAVAVRNLVENALIHGGVSPVRVRIALDGSDRLQLSVGDDGPGMPATVLPNGAVSDPRPANGHAGLGLSITRAVIESHGGHLRLENRPGCHADISLPRVQRTHPSR